MSKELLEALNTLEEEKGIDKDVLLDAIEISLLAACKSHFGYADNVRVVLNREDGDFQLYAEKKVVEKVTDPLTEISLEDAWKYSARYNYGDIVRVEIQSKGFGRITTQVAKNVILQKIREEERRICYEQFKAKEREVVTAIVQRYHNGVLSVNLGKCDGIMTEAEQVKTEHFRPTERIKVYILEVKEHPRGPRIIVSRTHPELVKRLFENEVAEIQDGTVEIKAISREAGSRTKMAVWSNDENVEPVGACVGMNGDRVNAIVKELRGEKIDIINWDPNPAVLIENALNPAKVICVIADEEEHTAQVIVPDYQLSLAIGKVGQNARLAARLTGFKIDIKSETQARESGLFEEIGYDEENREEYTGYEEYEVPMEDEYDDDYEDEYGEDYEDGYEEDYEDGYEENYEDEYEYSGGYESEDGYESGDGYEDGYEDDGYEDEVSGDGGEEDSSAPMYWMPGDEEQEGNDTDY